MSRALPRLRLCSRIFRCSIAKEVVNAWYVNVDVVTGFNFVGIVEFVSRVNRSFAAKLS